MKANHYLLVALATSCLSAGSAELPFKALCVSEKSTGFNWKSGQWVQANFRPDRKLLVQKLDLPKYMDRPMQERPISCTAEAMQASDLFGFSKGCYLIKDMGSPTNMFFDSEVCTEIVDSDKLRMVQCKKLTFHPDGGYIELPWHSDISLKPKEDYKDSLILSVGTCSRLSD